jgi:acyl dehydratase
VSALYYEDWTEGRRLVTRGRTIYDYDISAFVGLSGMAEELFINREYYENESLFKRRIAPGLLVMAISEGLVIQEGWLHRTGLAFLGFDEQRVTGPVAVGDTIHVEVEVVERRPTRQPGRGIVKTRHTVRKQDGTAVMTFLATRMIATRASSEGTP